MMDKESYKAKFKLKIINKTDDKYNTTTAYSFSINEQQVCEVRKKPDCYQRYVMAKIKAK